jgi:hypothetical protein
VKNRELAEIHEIFGRRRRTPASADADENSRAVSVPDATRTHAFRVYLSEALVYI